MELLYPAGPENVPPTLTKPTAAYKQRAWLATGGLLLFVVLYFALAGWFGWTAWKLLDGALAGGRDVLWLWVGGLCAAFLAVFMLKALFFVDRGGSKDEDIELLPAQEPQLFAFLHQLADQAGAPRPHRVFVSARVNAAVFYDLSVLNLLFPSKKNLEIGLGLVNVLNLGELKAVLAHEFGHFAQRSMAVGRWVYIAQQIAAHIIAKRDALDGFLRGLSQFDLRIAWIGWLLSLIVWSIRSLLETAFQLVVLAQRALSREMEMQADLVAVSLTGSDALINALHRIAAADEGWDRALAFANGQLAKKRMPRDLFAVQTRMIERMREILGNPAYGALPEPDAEAPQARRVFKAELAAPPRMWLSHPLNHEREENAKRVYIAAAQDERSAWALFADPAALRERISAHLAPESAKDAEVAPLEETLAAVDEQFRREYLDRRYRGVYLGRSAMRHAAGVADLYTEPQGDLAAALQALYPERLQEDLDRLRNLEREKSLLEALHRGVFSAPGGVIRHRGRELRKHELPRSIETLAAELAAAQAQVWEHDRLCRGAHRAAARAVGHGWEAYLDGLVRTVHYADHADAQLRDAQGALGHIINVATTARKVSKEDLARILASANELYDLLHTVYASAGQVQIGEVLAQRMGVASWPAALEEFTFSRPSEANINEWIKAIDSWINFTCNHLGNLEHAALEELLKSEALVARHLREGTAIADAPVPPAVTAQYAALTPGKERKRDAKPDWWTRFQAAEGMLPALARLLVAGAIVGGVLGLGGTLGDTEVVAYNGLARPVRVNLGGVGADLAPGASARLRVPAVARLAVQAHTAEGKLIESFEQDFGRNFSVRIYNVAGAAPLVEWTAVYGNVKEREPRLLGAPRWVGTGAEHIFEEPPKQIRTKGGGGTREVLTAVGTSSPGSLFDAIKDAAERARVIAVHARWDAAGAPNLAGWMEASVRTPGFDKLVAARLADNPREVLSLRMEQVIAGDKLPQVCERQRGLAAGAPTDGGLQYLAVRCMDDTPARDDAFIKGRASWPDNPWFAYAAGTAQAARGQLELAESSLEVVRIKEPALAANVILDLARLRRLRGNTSLDDLANGSEALRDLMSLESGKGITGPPAMSYVELAHGRVEAAVKMARGQAAKDTRLLRLAAASDGADPALAAQVLALDIKDGMDETTVWASIGLALRQRQDPAPFVALVTNLAGKESARLENVIRLLREGAPPAAVERAMEGMHPYLRAQFYSIGVIARGKAAPPAWRDYAKRALFASERPYFS